LSRDEKGSSIASSDPAHNPSPSAAGLDATRIVTHSGLLVAAGMIANVGNYAFQAIAGRMLTVEEFGVMNTLIGLCGASLVPAGALGLSITRWVALSDAAGDRRAVKAIVARAGRRLALYLVGVVVLFALAAGAVQSYLRLPHAAPLWIALLWIVTGLYLGILTAGLQGLRWFTRVAFLTVLAVAGRVAFGFLFMNADWQSSGALAGMMTANLLALGIACLALWPVLRDEGAPSFDTAPIYRYLFPVAVPMTVWSLMGSIDLVIVKHYFSPASAGHYAAAGLFGRALGSLVTPITLVLFPEWTRRTREGSDPASSRGLLLRSVVVVGVVGVVAALVCTLRPEWLLYLLKGKRELSTERLLPLFMWAMIPLSVAWIPYTFHLAVANIRRLYRLLPVFVVYVGGLLLWHHTLTEVLAVVAGGGTLSLVGLWWGSSAPHSHRKDARTQRLEDVC
jgi:O-antigen/teichoic acid export membrane protein